MFLNVLSTLFNIDAGKYILVITESMIRVSAGEGKLEKSGKYSKNLEFQKKSCLGIYFKLYNKKTKPTVSKNDLGPP